MTSRSRKLWIHILRLCRTVCGELQVCWTRLASTTNFRFAFCPSGPDTSNESTFLDNFPHSKSVVFNTQSSFKDTLEAYLTTPLDGFKSVGIGEHGSPTSRMDCLKKLNAILSKINPGNVTLTFNPFDLSAKPCVQYLDENWLDMTRNLLGSEDQYLSGLKSSDLWKVYSLLGTMLQNDG